MENEIKLSVVLPCYNEAPNLPLLLERYRQVAPTYAWELVLVDNGSTDDSAAVLQELVARPENAFARTVKVEVNQGYGYGIHQGLLAARGEVLAFSHADMQCDAAAVFAAYEKFKTADQPGQRVIIKGRRQSRHFAAQVLTTGMGLLATLVLWRPLFDINAQPKVFPKALLERMKKPPRGFEYDLYVLVRALRLGYKQDTVPVIFGLRAHGQSKWAFSFLSRWRTILRIAGYIFRFRFSCE